MNTRNKILGNHEFPAVWQSWKLLIFLALLSPTAVKSQTIGNWTFNSNTSGTAGLYNTVSIADFSSAIPTKAFQSSSIYFGENGWPAGAINLSAYLEFTLTPVTGHGLNILSVTLDTRRSNTGSSGASGPSSWSLRSSIDGYTTDIMTGSLGPNINSNVITLGSAFQGLTAAVSFRVYGYNTTVSSGGVSRFVYDNIKVVGSDIVLAPPLKKLRAVATSNGINLSFSSESYSTGTVYTLQRATDARNFITIHQFKNTSNSTFFNGFYCDEERFSGVDKLYYRLQITDINGGVGYSDVVFVKAPVYNEPTLQIRQLGREVLISTATSGPFYLRLVQSSGAQLFSRILDGPIKEWKVAMPSGLKGLSFLSIWNAKDRLTRALVWH